MFDWLVWFLKNSTKFSFTKPLFFFIFDRLYNGTLVHRLYHQLNSNSIPENLLSTSPKIYGLYCKMVQIVKDSTPPDFFQKKKSKSQRKKDKKVINKLPDTQESTMMDTLPLCNINRFATLAIENWKPSIPDWLWICLWGWEVISQKNWRSNAITMDFLLQ